MHQLLIAWAVACQHAMQALQRTMGGDRYQHVNMVVGWYFSKPEETYRFGRYEQVMTGAVCKKLAQYNNGVALLLNPVDLNGRAKYAISSFDDPRPDDANGPEGMRSVIATACHEVAHFVEDYHNEDYANLLTAISKRVDQREAWRSIQAAIKPVPGYYRNRPVASVVPAPTTEIETATTAIASPDETDHEVRYG
jgi:hypothetical protein